MGCSQSTEHPHYNSFAHPMPVPPVSTSARPRHVVPSTQNNTNNSNINRKIEGSLAWPGRDIVDPRAPFTFTCELSQEYRQSGRYKTQDLRHHGLSISLMNGDRVVEFYESINRDLVRMPLDRPYSRQAWVVGVAANPWRIAESWTYGLRKRLAHWGVYIRPVSANPQVKLHNSSCGTQELNSTRNPRSRFSA
jgi:hypothetical protein